MSTARDRILDVTWRLVEEQGEPAASMSAIARAAGVSRQAVYFHFPNRTELLLALVDHVDDQRDLAAWADKVQSAPDSVAKLRTLAEMQAERNPGFAALARALDGARHRSEAAATAWRSATDDRMRFCRELVATLDEEGHVAAGWDREEAAIVVWELTSFRVWDDLTGEAGLSAQRYVELVVGAVLATLAASPP